MLHCIPAKEQVSGIDNNIQHEVRDKHAVPSTA